MIFIIHLKDLKDFESFGFFLGQILKPGDILSLTGDLGAGKTTLTQSVAKGMGISEYVTSPTFTILNEYQGDIPLYHFDCYRIGEDDFLFMGFEDYLYAGGVSILEWGERVEGILPDSCVKVTIAVKDGERFIDFKGSKRALELERMIEDVGTWS